MDFSTLTSFRRSIISRLSILLKFLDVLLKRKCLKCQLACVNNVVFLVSSS